MRRYVSAILVAVPIWYVIGILISFSPEFVAAMGLDFVPTTGKAIAFAYGLAVGDLASGVLSQPLKSRRWAIAVFVGLAAVGTAMFPWRWQQRHPVSTCSAR